MFKIGIAPSLRHFQVPCSISVDAMVPITERFTRGHGEKELAMGSKWHLGQVFQWKNSRNCWGSSMDV